MKELKSSGQSFTALVRRQESYLAEPIQAAGSQSSQILRILPNERVSAEHGKERKKMRVTFLPHQRLQKRIHAIVETAALQV